MPSDAAITKKQSHRGWWLRSKLFGPQSIPAASLHTRKKVAVVFESSKSRACGFPALLPSQPSGMPSSCVTSFVSCEKRSAASLRSFAIR